MLTGAAVGAGTGGLAGALIGMGIPEDKADQYERDVKDGKLLVLLDRMPEKRIHSLTMNYTQLQVLLDIKYNKFTKNKVNPF